ncbi:hypothetical protein BCR33DRAFT_223198 [Rhizoclosmatium globosum]|uniref:Uncharacterized protein n=1 Tax=Rhizoclosmatium globosum TaxID=329046 RepID=A0A1Y2CDU3_9FUNG|nr:hypothetical protein BCR33DRAFT_223198 [Rhizoclosmatium globosum]|eukprot:ORY44475.1 hypothetical protein BCR33DRAFT_223198 [Rhizoclosmatium globosum]
MDNIGRCLDNLTRFDIKAFEKTQLVGQLQQLAEQLVFSAQSPTSNSSSTSSSRAIQISSQDSDYSDAWTTKRMATGLARFVDAERTSANSKAAKRVKDIATAEAKVSHAAAIVVLIWDKLDKAGQLDEGAGDVLFDHAVHSVISQNGAIYKPLVAYLKIIRKYLEMNHYRDSIPRTKWKALMEFSHIHLFPTADSDPTTLTSSDRKELAETLFYLSITHQKSMLPQSLPLLREIIGFLQTKPQEIGAHPALLTLACHLLLENFVNWRDFAELSDIIDSLVVSILPIWDKIQGREAYYRPVRGSIILINRLYLFLARLKRIESHSDVIKSTSIVISPSADTVSLMYQIALRGFRSKKVGSVTQLSNPSLLLTALHSSYSQLCPYLSLDHATNYAFSDAEDMNDTSVSTYTFLELFAEILYHTLFPNEGIEMPIEVESPGDTMDELDVSQEASRKRRIVRSLSQSLTRSSPVTTVLEDLVTLLQSSNTNQRNLALQSLAIFVSCLTLHHTNTVTMTLFATQLLQPLTSLLSSDVQNPWVYILLSILPKVESDFWPRVLELCTRKHEASPCEPSFALLKSLGAPIPAQFTVTPSLLRSLNEFCGKPEKERRNMVASILALPTPMIPFDLTLASIYTLLGDAPLDPKPSSKLNYTPRTDIILQEFRFGCLKSSITLLMLEKYEIMIPPTLCSSPTTTLDVSWVLNQLEKLLDIEMDSEKTTWVLCMYFKLGGQRSTVIIDALRRVCIHDKKQHISEGTLRLLVEVLDSLVTVETETDLLEDLSKLVFGGNVHVHTEINDSNSVGSVMSNGVSGSLVYYGGCNSSSSNAGRGQWLVKLLRARIARILTGEKVVEIVKEELGHGFLGFGGASINCSRDLLQKILDTVEDCLIRKKNHWIWMEVLDLLQSLVQSILSVKDPKQIGFFTKTVGFFAKEMQKGQLIWQLYVKFAALLQEIILHDPQHNFLVSSSTTDFFTTPKVSECFRSLTYVALEYIHSFKYEAQSQYSLNRFYNEIPSSETNSLQRYLPMQLIFRMKFRLLLYSWYSPSTMRLKIESFCIFV